jgi:hypothetical protein
MESSSELNAENSHRLVNQRLPKCSQNRFEQPACGDQKSLRTVSPTFALAKQPTLSNNAVF